MEDIQKHCVQVDWQRQWNKNIQLLQGRIQGLNAKVKIISNQEHKVIRIQYSERDWYMFKVIQDQLILIYRHIDDSNLIRYQEIQSLPKYTQLQFYVTPLCVKVYCVKFEGVWYLSSDQFVYDRRMYCSDVLQVLNAQKRDQLVLYVSKQEFFNVKVTDDIQEELQIYQSNRTIQGLLNEYERDHSLKIIINDQKYRIMTKTGIFFLQYNKHLFVNKMTDTLLNLKDYIDVMNSLNTKNSAIVQLKKELNAQQKQFESNAQEVLEHLKILSVYKLKEFMVHHKIQWSGEVATKSQILQHIEQQFNLLNTTFKLKDLLSFNTIDHNNMAQLNNKEARFCSTSQSSIKNRGFMNKFQIISEVNKQKNDRGNTAFHLICNGVLQFQKQYPYDEKAISDAFANAMKQLDTNQQVVDIMYMFEWSKKRRILESKYYYDQITNEIKDIMCK